MSKINPDKGATRRSALGFGAASIAAAACAAPAVAKTAPMAKMPIRFNDPIWNRETSARLQADTNGSQVFGRCSGMVYGVRPGEANRELVGFEVFSTIRVLRLPGGSYQRMTKETIFYTDPKTGVILDEWDNPYTGEKVRVVDVANDPYNWVISATVQPPSVPGAVRTGQDIPGGRPFISNYKEFGPDTIVLEEGGSAYYPNLLKPSKWPRESGGEMVQATELFTYFINRADLENPAMTHLPHNGVWVRVTPWLPWMLMGQAPGHILYKGAFRPARDTKYYPPGVIERVKAKFPSFMTAPTEWYGPSYSSIEHYAAEQKPAPVK